MGRQRIRDHGHGNRAVVAAATAAATSLSMKVTGGKSEKREDHYEKQRLVASHPTPHGRSVCDYLLYLIPRRRRKNSRLDFTAERRGRHFKNRQGVRVLNTSKEARCATVFPGDARMRRARGRVCYRNWTLHFSGREQRRISGQAHIQFGRRSPGGEGQAPREGCRARVCAP